MRDQETSESAPYRTLLRIVHRSSKVAGYPFLEDNEALVECSAM